MTHPEPPHASSLLRRAHALAPELVALRRDLHRHPELSFQEHRTAGIAADAVSRLGFRLRTGVARTGVVADLLVGRGTGEGAAEPGTGAAPQAAMEAGTEVPPAPGAPAASTHGPTIALRADMDALPIGEANDHDFVSTTPGVMHACGHDAHVAGLVGAARLLVELDREGALPPGRIRLLFQPSEEAMDSEGKSGGRRMAEEGAMEGVDAVVGLHVGAHLETGRVFLAPGPFFGGTDTLRITVHGKAAHAARPHEGIDALVLAAQGVMAAQQVVARRVAPESPAVLSFGTIHGGNASNIICDRVELTGTLRYFDPGVREAIHQGVRAAFGALEAQGARVEVQVVEGYPPVVNDPGATRRVLAAAEEVAGPGILAPDAAPAMTAEDFSFLAAHAPGAFFWLGAALPDPREHHHPRFDIDESVIPLGAALLAGAARTLLRDPP